MTKSGAKPSLVTAKSKREAQAAAPRHPFEWEAERLVSEVESLSSSFASLMNMTRAVHDRASEEWHEFLRAKGEPIVENETGRRAYRVSALNYETGRKLDAKRGQAERATHTVPRGFVVSLTSAFDAFLGRLIRGMYTEKPQLFQATKRAFTLEEIQQYDRISQVVDLVLDEEVEGVIRESRRKQFAWMEGQFSVRLTKELDCWARFVELSERRNLFVHTDGFVSKQYKQVCGEVGYKWAGQEPGLNTTLDASREYFEQACDSTLEVGLKLLWVLWRKQAPADLLRQDRSFLNTTYRIIADEHHAVAAELLEFALSEPAWKFYDEDSRLRCILNLAQAHKWAGREDRCRSALARQSWDPLSPVFRLAALILDDRFAEAAGVLPQAVRVDELNAATFVQWPIFKEFRKTDDFKAAFKETFGSDYSSVVSDVGSESPAPAVGKVENGGATQSNVQEHDQAPK